jgi:hypothetical protein
MRSNSVEWDAPVRCECCEQSVRRGAEIPAARWIRFGDGYCESCSWLLPRDLIETGFDKACCPEHGRRPMEKVTPLAFEDG